MLLLQRQRESIDDRSQDFQQFRNPVVALRLVDELIENVIDRSTDEGAQIQEFAVDSMERCFEEISLAWIFTIEQLEQLASQKYGQYEDRASSEVTAYERKHTWRTNC